MKNLKTLLIYLFIFSLPLAPIKFVPIFSLDTIFVLCLLLIQLNRKRRQYKTIELQIIVASTLTFYLFFSFSSFLNDFSNYINTTGISLINFFVLIIYIDKEDFKTIERAVLISIFCISSFILIRGFYINELSIMNYYLKIPGGFGFPIFNTYFYRNFGLYNTSGIFALWFNLGYSILLLKIIESKKKNKIILCAFLLLVMIVIFLSLSRNAWLLTMFSTLVILFMKVKIRLLIPSFFLIIIALLFVQNIFILEESGKNFFYLEDRINMLQGILELINKNIFFGVGSYSNYNSKNLEVHNTYLMLLVNNGIVASFFFFIILIIPLFYQNIIRSNALITTLYLCTLLSISFFDFLLLIKYLIMAFCSFSSLFNSKDRSENSCISFLIPLILAFCLLS